MSMDAKTSTLLFQLGLLLITKLVAGDKDTTALETEIAETKDEDAVKAIAIREALDAVALDEPTAGIVSELVAAGDAKKVKEVILKPENRKGLLQSLADAIGALISALFGSKD